jgi:hypothetical protein
MPILVREIAFKNDSTSGIAVSELGVLHAKNVHHYIIILLFLFYFVDPNPQNIALIVARVSAGVKLNIVVIRISVLRIAVPFVFIMLKRMVVVLLTLETITI